jgi:hypothetical protein
MNKIFALAMFAILSCGQEPKLPGFDSQRWQEDADGCSQQRIALADEVVKRKAELVGLNENEIAAIFGKPNRHELYSRNKKAYVYFIKGGTECSEPMENPLKLVIRFNGIGRAKEIILYNK